MADWSLELYREKEGEDVNSISQMPEIILNEMKLLNLVIFLFITVITVHAQRGYIQDGSALRFLVESGTIPILFWKLPATVVMLCAAFMLLLSIPCNNHPELVIKLLAEYGIALWISALTGFGYTGAVLLLLADAMRYRIDWKKRIWYIALICILYLVMNGNILQDFFHTIPLSQMWMYYRQDARNSLLGILNMLGLINTLVFILYMVVLTITQTSEKERILRLNSQLQAANRKLEEYAEEQVRMTETRERNRLAREIHDTLGHSLTGIISGIEACIVLMDIAPDATKEQLRAIAEVARTGIIDVRRSVKALHPDALETMDLENALLKMIDTAKRSTGVEITYFFDADLNHFNQDEEDVVYRVVQESITNAIRHGQATKIRIEITRVDGDLHILILDNGKGCENIEPGFGLHHMQERVEMLGGDLQYKGDKGFTVHARIPIRWGTETDNR